MGTIVMTGSQHKCCFNVDRVVMTGSHLVMTGSHHGNDNDDWQSAEKVCQAPLPRASTLRILVSGKAQNSSGEYLSRFPGNQHAVVVTSADLSTQAPRATDPFTNQIILVISSPTLPLENRGLQCVTGH